MGLLQNTTWGSVALSLRAQLHIAFALTNNGTLCLIGHKGSQSRKKYLPKLKNTNGDIGRFQYRHCKVPPVFIPMATSGFYNVLYNSYSGIFSPKALPGVFCDNPKMPASGFFVQILNF